MPALRTLNMNMTNHLIPLIKVEDTQSYSCNRCSLKFSQPDTLKHHQVYYCQSAEPHRNNSSPPSSTSRDGKSSPVNNPTPTASSIAQPMNGTSLLPSLSDALAALIQQQQQRQQQHALVQQLHQQQQQVANSVLGVGSGTVQNTSVIILPVAYHNNTDASMVQVIGPPQTVIPVAVSQTLPLRSRSLLLDGSFSSQVQLPVNGKLAINPTAGEFGLTLAFLQSAAQQIDNATPTTSHAQPASTVSATATILAASELNPNILCRKRMRATSSECSIRRRSESFNSSPRPLDLSKKVNIAEESKQGDAKKPYACECGVSFMSLDTLGSHRKYYCKHRAPAEDTDELEPHRKVPSRCSQCDYVPATHAQLSQHVRHKHSLVQAFVCLICGYKGYSARGIKNHLRSAHADDLQQRRREPSESDGALLLSDQSLLQDYVFCVTADTKQLHCERCRLSFPTEDLLQRHECRAADKSGNSSS